MNRLNHKKSFLLVLGVIALLAPKVLLAQHFGHGGGGGGFHGGGGGFHGGGGGGFHAAPARGGGGHDIPGPRSINGGTRNFGSHPMPAAHIDRGVPGRGNIPHPF